MLPSAETVAAFAKIPEVADVMRGGDVEVHKLAQHYLKLGKVEEAWKILLAGKD